MTRNYASLAFTPEVKALQERYGSRHAYARIEAQSISGELTKRELDFIQARDSFYIASIGENGFPYIQHRGGPKGFLRPVDSTTLGFVDFRGNKQYITAGNTVTRPKISVILMDYPNQTRMKIYAEVEVLDVNDHSELAAFLTPKGYENAVEQIILLHVAARDWNCPKHIVPRYTAEEIDPLLAPLHKQIERLQSEIKQLKIDQGI